MHMRAIRHPRFRPARWRAGLRALLPVAVLGLASTGWAERSGLAGHWVLNHERTAELQPDGPARREFLSRVPRTSVSVGGVPLPRSGGQLPSVAGSARDPRVLATPTLTIEPAPERLTLIYAGGVREQLARGNDQGLISRWSGRKLTSRYQTTSRKVSQVYQVQRDGSLLVTVKLNPDEGPTLIHKRLFEPADAASP